MIRILAVILSLLLFCTTDISAKKPKKQKKNKKEVVKDTTPQVALRIVDADRQARYDYFYQGALIEKSCGNDSAAAVLLQHCIEIDPDAAEAYYALADSYDVMHEDSLQILMLLKAAEFRPDNDTYKESLLPIYLQQNRISEAAGIAEDIVQRTPERTDMLRMLLSIYDYQKDNEGCLSVLKRMETQNGLNEETTLAKVQILSRLERNDEAYSELQQLCESHPLDLNYRVLFGNWLMGRERRKEAVEQYERVLSEEPDNEDALLSMWDYCRVENLTERGEELRDKLLLGKNVKPETQNTMLKFYLRECAQNNTDSTLVLQMFRRMQEAHPESVDILEYKYAYQDMQKMHPDSLKQTLEDILELAPDNSEARLRLMQMAWDNGDNNRVVELCKPGLEFNPDIWDFNYWLSLAYYVGGQYEECILSAEKGRQTMVVTDKNKESCTGLLQVLGESYYKCNEEQKAYEVFDEGLKIDPDDIQILNNYAYYLSLGNRSDEDLEKAEEMSLKSVKAEPSNASYLDTYAWILFLQKRYEEAAIYIDMAEKYWDQDRDNEEIVEHSKAIHEWLEKNRNK